MAVAEKVTVELELKDGQYQSRIRQNERVFAQAMDKTGDAAELAERRVRNASDGISTSLKAAAGTLAAGFGAQAVANLADSYTRFTNQLKVAGLEGQSLAGVQESLFQIAQKNGVELENLGRLYGGLSVLQKDLNTTSADSLSLTTAVAQSIRISGTSSAQAAGAILGLNQALAQTRVQSDEYNQILDGARPLLLAAVQGTEKYGGSLAKLKQDIEAGNVSGAKLFEILQNGFPVLAAQAEKANLTIGNSLIALNNALGQYIGQTDASLSATERVSQGIKLLSDNLDTIIPAIAVLATLVGGRFAVAMTTAAVQTGVATANSIAYQLALARMAAAQTGATTAQVLLNAALTANPIGIVVTAVAALAAGLFILATRYSATAIATRELDAASSAAAVATDQYAKALEDAANKTGKEKDEALKLAAAIRQTTAARIADLRVTAQNRINEAGEARDVARRAGALVAEQARNPRANFDGEGAVIGQIAFASGAAKNAQERKALADAALAALRVAERALVAVETPAPRLSVSGVGGGVRTGSGTRVGGTSLAPSPRPEEQDLDRLESIDLDPLGDDAQRIGRMVAEGFAAEQKAFADKGSEMARAFTDIATSGDVWAALGRTFADAAANNLQTLLSQVFTAVFANQGQGASILNGIGTVLGFGGGRANGGPVRAGWSYDVGENGREKFVAPSNGYILPNMNTVAQRASSVTRVEVRQTFDLMGVTGDAAIYSNVSQMIKQGQAETLAIANRAAPGAQRQRALLKD